MTLDEAKNLKLGQVIYSRLWTNADGSPQRWRVNGKVKTWVRSPERVKVPLKRGLYEFSYLTETYLENFDLTEEGAIAFMRESLVGFERGRWAR